MISMKGFNHVRFNRANLDADLTDASFARPDGNKAFPLDPTRRAGKPGERWLSLSKPCAEPAEARSRITFSSSG